MCRQGRHDILSNLMLGSDPSKSIKDANWGKKERTTVHIAIELKASIHFPPNL